MTPEPEGGETVGGGSRSVFETSPDAILVHDEAGQVSDANVAAVELFETPREQLRGRTLADIAPAEADAGAVFRRAADTGSAETEWEVRQSDDRTRWVDVSLRRDDDGTVVTFLRDLTARRHLELDLRHERRVFERVLDTTPTGILVLDGDGEITMANPRAAEILGLATSELAGRQHDDPGFEVLSVDSVPLEPDELPFARIEAADGPIEDEQVRVETPDGERVLSVNGAPLRSADGAFDGAVLSIQDVTSEYEARARVREQQARLEAVVGNLPVVLFALDEEGTFTLSRGRGLESLGLEPGELNGVSVFEAYADYPDIVEACERALDGETLGTTQRVGDSVFETRYRPVTDEDGDLEHVIGVSLDVTERKAREEQLEEKEAILGQLTETTDDVFWLFDGDFSEIQFVNEAYEDVWGRSIEDLHEDPMDFMAGVHPDDRDRVAGAVDRLTSGEPTHVEYRVNPGEDFGRWVSVRGDPVLGEDGRVERVAGYARDITERKERERDLERSERQFEAVFNDPQLLVGILDPDGTVRRVNETALTVGGTEHDDIVGQPFPETPFWTHDEDQQADLREWIGEAADGEYVTFEADHPLPDGREITVDGHIRPVLDDGEVVSLVASARDVTARKERERQLEESNERLEQFAYVASHDLQEPLRTVSNYAEMLAEDYAEDLDEQAREFIDVVVTGSQRMQSMINGLLDYSRVTTRGDDFRPVDADAAVADVADDLGVLLDEHDGTLRWEDLPTVEADGDQFRQLVQNLVTNALEHADGPVEVDVRATEHPDHYRFEVADDGPGIAENRQEKIFRIFKSGTQYQTSSQAKGIGLAICDNIVKRHEGDIWVESTPGEGATFVFTIPKPTGDGPSPHA